MERATLLSPLTRRGCGWVGAVLLEEGVPFPSHSCERPGGKVQLEKPGHLRKYRKSLKPDAVTCSFIYSNPY